MAKKLKSTSVAVKGREKKKEENKKNPFEQKVNKTKFTIEGRRLKGTETNVGQSRSRSIENRKRTLLVEMRQKGKANEFEDQRIGETDSSLNEDEKALIRYQKEVKKRYSKGMFNLDDEETEQLTHLGENIGEMKSFDDYRGNSDDEEVEDALDKEVVSKLHFGGFEKVSEEDGQEREKTRDQVYQEIIAKSKAAKREKAKGKQEQEELNEKLDLDFADLRDEIALMRREKLTDEEKKEKGIGKTDYDKNVRELAFEVRAQPTDRTKKPEEIAKEEAERLEELEKERIKRMKGEDIDEDTTTNKKKKTQNNVHRSADSLEDDFVPDKDDEGTLAYSLNSDEEELSGQEDKKSDGEEDEEGEEGSEEESEEEDEGEDLEDDQQVQEEEDEGEEEVKKTPKKTKKTTLKKGEEIPFTFSVPTSHAEFAEWVEDRNPEELNLIITRIRTCNHVSLHPDNKKKLEGFCEVLLEHFFHLSASLASLDSVPISHLNVLTKHLFEMKETFGDRFFQICRDRVLVFQEALSHKLNVEKGTGSCWPSFGHLLFFQLMAKIYPVTDFQHFALTPAMILLNQYLSQCPVKNAKEYSIALFVANIVYHYVKSTKRYSPEAIRFLTNGIASFNGKSKETNNIPKGFLQFKQKNSQKLKTQSLPLSIFAGTLREKKEFFSSDQWRLDAFRTTLNLLSQYVHLYEESNSFNEMSIDIIDQLNGIEKKELNKEIQKEVEDLISFMSQNSEKCIRKRKPMKFIITKPKEIRSLNPKFQETGYGKKKNLDERTVFQNLQKAVKKQKKGAMRELKKDNAFIQSEKNKKRREEADEREQKRRKIMASLETQQSELKLSEKLKKGGNPKGKSAF